MTRRRMFLRMITAALLRRRSRMVIALLSIAVGATILSGLLTIYYDVPRQMSAQFRNYGANMLLMPSDGEDLTLDLAEATLDVFDPDELVGAAPYRYIQVDMTSRQLSFTAAGTDFDQIQNTSPYFSVEGRYPENNREILVGGEVAELIGVKEGSVITLTYQQTSELDEEATGSDELTANATLSGTAPGFEDDLVGVTVTLDDEARIASLTVDASTQTAEVGGQCEEEEFTDQFIGLTIPVDASLIDGVSGATITSDAVIEAVNNSHTVTEDTEVMVNSLNFTVTGILDTGGDEENYIFMSLSDMSALTGDEEDIDVMELSVSTTQEELEDYLSKVDGLENGVEARLVKRVTNSEASVLSTLQALILLVTVVILILTMISVSTTMTAVISERRKEIGLRKALGASDGSIRAEFLGEGMFLGLLGGLLGSLLGFLFAEVVSVSVFDSSITFLPWLLPLSVVVSMIVSGLSCLTPIRNAVAIDPAVVLKGE